jgi:hypothetical protein
MFVTVLWLTAETRMSRVMRTGVSGPRIYRSIPVRNCRPSSVSIVLRMESTVLILLVLSATVTMFVRLLFHYLFGALARYVEKGYIQCEALVKRVPCLVSPRLVP